MRKPEILLHASLFHVAFYEQVQLVLIEQACLDRAHHRGTAVTASKSIRKGKSLVDARAVVSNKMPATRRNNQNASDNLGGHSAASSSALQRAESEREVEMIARAGASVAKSARLEQDHPDSALENGKAHRDGEKGKGKEEEVVSHHLNKRDRDAIILLVVLCECRLSSRQYALILIRTRPALNLHAQTFCRASQSAWHSGQCLSSSKQNCRIPTLASSCFAPIPTP